jgi:hypothetical protein
MLKKPAEEPCLAYPIALSSLHSFVNLLVTVSFLGGVAVSDYMDPIAAGILLLVSLVWLIILIGSIGLLRDPIERDGSCALR